ncbi:MAG: hypothetical protein AB7P04_01910 [Bacteriovoracia bacterium]
MKKFFISIIAVCLMCACGPKNSGPEQPPTKYIEYDLSETLPAGVWKGEGYSHTSIGEKNHVEIEIQIDRNNIITDTYSGVFHGVAHESFEYVSKGLANVIHNDEKIGTCRCALSMCDCDLVSDGVTMNRIITFSKIGIDIVEAGSLGDLTFEQTYRLYVKK